MCGYPRKAEQVGRDSGARRAPLSRLKLVPQCATKTSKSSFSRITLKSFLGANPSNSANGRQVLFSRGLS